MESEKNKIYITRKIPESGIKKLEEAGYEIDTNPEDRVLSKEELIEALRKKEYNAVLPLLTDTIDKDVFEAAPHAKIFANYAVGFNNIDLEAAKSLGVTITNTPGVLTDSVAEHAMALILASAKRLIEADNFTRAGEYQGWAPMLLLGSDLKGKTLGLVGAGRIGSRVAMHAKKGFEMNVIYYDIKSNPDIEKEGATYKESLADLLSESDFVSVHVPLLDSTRHLINEEMLSHMKSNAYLVNTSRGPVIDEKALTEALKNKKIRGAALDVFEEEPRLTAGLTDMHNVILTPHIASATEETRSKMSDLAAQNIIDFLSGQEPKNKVA